MTGHTIIRSNLHTDPKVLAIARSVQVDNDGVPADLVRNAVVGSLSIVWSTASQYGVQHGEDIHLKHATAETIDAMVGMEIADAMASVGWLVEGENGCIFPGLASSGIDEESKEDRKRRLARERAREYRQRKKAERDDCVMQRDDCVTRNVTTGSDTAIAGSIHNYIRDNVLHLIEGKGRGKEEGGTIGGLLDESGEGMSFQELENQKKEKEKIKKKENERKAKLTAQFEEFWQVYPRGRRTGKKDAKKAWDKAVKEADPEVIIQAAMEYAESPLGNSKYVKGPAPWLNQGCWEDDRAAWQMANHNEPAKSPKKKAADTFWEEFVNG